MCNYLISENKTCKISPNKELILVGYYSAWLTNIDQSLTINALGSKIVLTVSKDFRALSVAFNGGYNINATINAVTKTVTSYSIINNKIKYGTIEFRRAGSASAGQCAILGSNKFENIIDGSALSSQAHSILFEENVVNVVNDFNVNGKSSTNIITIGSCSSTAVASVNLHYLVRNTDLDNSIAVNYVSVTHSSVTPAVSGSVAIWSAKNSVNVSTAQPNYGWNFINIRYWVGGSDTWNTTAGNKWSSDKGGVGGSTVPSVNDDVYFDNSPAPSWADNTTYTANLSIVSPTSGNETGFYYAAVATKNNGKSGSAEPIWPNITQYDPNNPLNNRFDDNNVTWETRKAHVTRAEIGKLYVTSAVEVID